MSKKSEKKERLGVFVPVYKNYAYLKHMLDSLQSQKRDIEVFIINNGSDDDTNKFCKILARRKGFHVKHFDKPLGVAKVWNMCLDWAIKEDLDLIVISNSDVLYHANCLDMMLKFMERSEKAILACPLDIKKVDEVIKAFPFVETKALAAMTYNAEAINNLTTVLGAVKSPTNDPQTVTTSIDYSSFILRPDRLLDQVGYFDEGFLPAYWEDSDMHWRLAQIEHVTKTISNAYTLHIQSRSTLEGGLSLDSYVPNAFYFAKKHNITFRNDQVFRNSAGEIFAIKTLEAEEAYETLQTDPERRIFECIVFDHELDILELHLEALYDSVEQFIIIEAPFDLNGNPKPLYLKENKERFARFAPKLRRMVLSDFKDAASPVERKNKLLRSLPAGIKNTRFTDFIVLSDVASLPDVKKIKEFQRMSGVKVLSQKVLQGFLNIADGSVVEGSKICTVKVFLDDFGSDLANFALAKGFKITDGGWFIKPAPPEEVERHTLNKTYTQLRFDYRHLDSIRRDPERFKQWTWDRRRTNTHKGEAQIDVTLFL